MKNMKSLMRLDPFRMISKWDPFEDLRRMQRDMDRLFDRFLGDETMTVARPGIWMPSIESYYKDGHLVFKAEIPGVDQKDLDVSVTDRELVIKGERKVSKDAKEENYIHREIAYGSFERRFTLPEGVKTDELKAKFSNGILEITVPAPAVPKARKVEIETREAKAIEGEAKKAA
jgi:HSP20 family protein